MQYRNHEENAIDAAHSAALTTDECTVCKRLFYLREGFGWNVGQDTNRPFFVCLPCCGKIPADSILERIAATYAAEPAPAETLN